MRAVSNGFNLFFKMLKKSPHLVGLLLALNFCNLYFFFPDLEILQVQIRPEDLLKISMFLSVTIFNYFYILMLVGYSAFTEQNLNFLGFVKKNILAVLTDVVRAYNVILLFSLMLILPGIYKQLKLIFVPYIAMERDKNLSIKEFDSLKQSSLLMASWKIMLALLAIIILWLPLDLFSAFVVPNTLIDQLIVSVVMTLALLYHSFVASFYQQQKTLLKN